MAERNFGQPLLNLDEDQGLDGLLRLIFINSIGWYGRKCPVFVRRVLELVILLMAVYSLFILLYAHIVIAQNSATCLEDVQKTWSKEGILRVEVVQTFGKEYTMDMSYARDYVEPEDEEREVVWLLDLFQINPIDLAYTLFHTLIAVMNKLLGIFIYLPAPVENFIRNHTYFATFLNEDTYRQPKIQLEDSYIFEYALDDGLVTMDRVNRNKYNIPMLFLVLDPDTNECIGNSLTKFILSEYLGYNQFLKDAMKSLLDEDHPTGMIRDVINDKYYNTVSLLTIHRLTSPFAAIVITVLFTLVTSALIITCHSHIQKFIEGFLFYLSVSLLISLMSVNWMYMGLETLLQNYFGDTTIPFCIIIIVWCANKYDVICCYSSITKRHWLKFFYLYHYMFYAYNYRFKGQYTKLALVTSCLFILHSMVYFFHHYEVPLILNAFRWFHFRQSVLRHINNHPMNIRNLLVVRI